MSFHNWYKSIYPLTLEVDVFKLVESAWEQSAKEEREACTEIAEAAGSDANKYDIADSIRARGEAKKDEVPK